MARINPEYLDKIDKLRADQQEAHRTFNQQMDTLESAMSKLLDECEHIYDDGATAIYTTNQGHQRCLNCCRNMRV